MRSVIIILIFSSFVIHPNVHVSAAQDMFIQAPAISGLSSVGMNEVNADLISPPRIQVEINGIEFTEISWRGCTMEFPKFTRPLSYGPAAARIDRAKFNSFCNKPPADQQQILRQAWAEALGIDIWYPYYQAKKVEGWVKKKCSVRIFKLKGEPIVEKGRVMYTFRTAF